jgi:hypothetical protein
LNEKEEWILILKKLDRINRIIWIIRPSAERPLAAGEKIPDNPVTPVYIKIIKIESIPHLFIYLKFHIPGSGFKGSLNKAL